MEKMDAKTIIQESGMSGRPEFYSGRGATMSDLNYDILKKAATLIEKHHGKEALKNFVEMVGALPKATATDFLNQLYILEARDWKFEVRSMDHANGVDVGDHQACLVPAMMTVAHAFDGMSDRNDTGSIRNQFLREYGVKPKGKDIDKFGIYSEDGRSYRRMEW